MKLLKLALLASVIAAPAFAEETREMGAHVHGVSTLELAVENSKLEMNLLSPGMDIVGFEYAASTDADKDAVEAAIRTLLMPENVVSLPDAAECRISEVLAHLHAGEHDHEDGEEHAEHEHEEHDDHDEHEHEDHAEEEGHEHEHEEGGEHSEFHARYIFDCEHPAELTTIAFPFFNTFENAQEIEAKYVTDAGAGTSEIARDAAELTLN